ncbi:hypothetical protein POSPLADRAFT_1037332 [Postia placenta MAD-698-R-SB12]|uniref:Uncharacterized protein n=1 Tax=Postia placenta MAD-698-R-SB12 TaxID=670580 RepID=A0A1X6MK77_9APHY|nr:hypothetical protein POSPLADRAFT_1037332 [Postia placenta MAD-698-R-SB12]OSX56602.1 hypothetical protein POSPLADRAFT_1037332 [Postia placenta MAD-698-R-SB12]
MWCSPETVVLWNYVVICIHQTEDDSVDAKNSANRPVLRSMPGFVSRALTSAATEEGVSAGICLEELNADVSEALATAEADPAIVEGVGESAAVETARGRSCYCRGAAATKSAEATAVESSAISAAETATGDLGVI